MSGNGGGLFVPDPATVYRLFYRELEDNGTERLRQVVGRVRLYEDGSALVVPATGAPTTWVRTYEKIVVYVPGRNDPPFP